MSFTDDSGYNVKKYNSSFKERKKQTLSLKEVTGGSVAGFVGGKGMGIDAIFAGPYHPDSSHGSQNKQLLAKQLKDRRKKRKDLESDRDDVIDDYVLTASIDTISELNVSFYNINDLTGIEDFSNLEKLDCSYNLLEELDISQNTQLVELICYQNQLIELDVSQNIELTYFWNYYFRSKWL